MATFLHLIPVLLLALTATTGCGEKVHKLDVAEYYKEVDIDPDKAEKKYKDSFIELTARVWTIGMTDGFPNRPPSPVLMVLRKPDITIDDLGSDNLLLFITKDPQPWKKVAPGGTVTVRGRCDQWGGAMAPILAECEIISATGDPVPFVTAEQLATEFKADAEAAKAKYDKERDGLFEPVVVVEGEITKIDGPDDYHVHLKTDNGVSIAVSFGGIGWQDKHKKLKVGERVQVIGEPSFHWNPYDILILSSQDRVDPK